MCNFFSFCGDGFGNYQFFNLEQRKNHNFDECDSHTAILEASNILPELQDRWSRYEYNPLTKKFTIDHGVEGHDHEAAKKFIRGLDFKLIAPLLVKDIIHPFKLKKRKPTKADIERLKHWISIWDSVGDSVGASMWESVRASVQNSVGNSVWDSIWASVGISVWESVWASVGDIVWASIWDSVRASVWASVRDSVRAYSSSFFDIKYKHDFSVCIKLWERGLVPSFDGKTWRLHSGKNAEIVYEWIKEA